MFCTFIAFLRIVCNLAILCTIQSQYIRLIEMQEVLLQYSLEVLPIIQFSNGSPQLRPHFNLMPV